LSPCDIIYEDNHLLVVNKPAGLLSQPTDRESNSLETLLKAWLKEKYQKPGEAFLGIVHRLDKSVSGIVICAKTSKALSRLNESLRAKDLQKIYYALVEGSPPQEKGTLEHFLRHDDYRAYASLQPQAEAKLARLHYAIIKRFKETSLLEITLETGRYHQIRAQCAAVGCPIVGDVKYGSKSSLPGGIIALHHFRCTFQHPVTKITLALEAPLSKIFSDLEGISKV